MNFLNIKSIGRLIMKANVNIILILALMAGACSSGTHLSTGYDDLYYTPGDEAVATENSGEERQCSKP
jgi:hypothetical protein